MAKGRTKPRFAAIGAGTRLKAGPSEELVQSLYEPICFVGPRYFAAMCKVNYAHVVGLTEVGIISRKAGAALLRGLREVERLGSEGFPVEPAAGDLFTSIEAYLIHRLGADQGGNLQLARSRADLHAAVDRLVVREGLIKAIGGILALREAALKVASGHLNSILPSFTFLQHAQLMTFAHYLVGSECGWTRDTMRLLDAYERADASVLGTLIGSGSGWPLNRARVQELLGHRRLIVNAKDAVWDGDFILEAHTACAILISRHLRLINDLYEWSSYEFGLVELADEDSGSSSIMPQKKNPYALVSLRNRSTRVLAELQGAIGMACLGSYRADMLGLNLPSVLQAMEETACILGYSAKMLSRLRFNAARGLHLAESNFATVTELVDTIVRHKRLSYRKAHHAVATAVRMVLDASQGIQGITADLLDQASERALDHPLNLSEKEIRGALDPTSFVAKRTTRGGTAPREVQRMLREGEVSLRRDRSRVAGLQRRIQEGERKLGRAVQALLARA